MDGPTTQVDLVDGIAYWVPNDLVVCAFYVALGVALTVAVLLVLGVLLETYRYLRAKRRSL
jgi:hypothetical protein